MKVLVDAKQEKKFVCLGCNKEHVLLKNRTGKYCSNACQQNHAHQRFIKKWISGEIAGATSSGVSEHIKKYLMLQQNGACSACLNTLWCGKPIPLEIEHKDGNAFNHAPSNVSLLCANCHSQTATYKGKNRGRGRLARAKKMVGAV